MYNRATRFKSVLSNTPKNVGPATYFIPDLFGKNKCVCRGNNMPFNSSEIRKITFVNRSLSENPAPKYKICFRKNRITGGTSMQKRAARFKYKTVNVTRGPYTDLAPQIVPGKIYRGVPPRVKETVPSVPNKGTVGYNLTSDGPEKVCFPPENRPVGPTTYYNPEGVHSFTTTLYKGNFWSLRSANRFRYRREEGPGPAAYNIGTKPEPPFQKYQDLLRSQNVAAAPLLRTNDILQRKLCRESMPGPGHYSPSDPNTTKCDCGNQGTFMTSQRQPLHKVIEGPGPDAYTDPRSALHSKGASLKRTGFGVEAARFSRAHNLLLPGPGAYDLHNSISDDIKKKEHSRYAQWNAPFDSTAVRNMVLAKADSACTPGPDYYYPEFQEKGDHNKSSMFASSASRSIPADSQASPGPAYYSTTEPFKTLTNQKSHLLQTKKAGFLSSGDRLQPLGDLDRPGPTTYNLPESTLNTKGCIIGEREKEKKKEITPGPPDYKVHPKYAKSSVLGTFNATLGAVAKKPAKKRPMNIERKLRCFSSRRYLSGHCDIRSSAVY